MSTWKFEKETRTIRREPENYWVCSMDSWEGSLDHEANARLIAAAVNSCFQINPDNPLAVAEALPELVEACHKIMYMQSTSPLEACAYQGATKKWIQEVARPMEARHKAVQEAQGIIRDALAKIGANHPDNPSEKSYVKVMREWEAGGPDNEDIHKCSNGAGETKSCGLCEDEQECLSHLEVRKGE